MPQTAIRRTAAEIIAIHLCSDIADVRDGRYQATRQVNPPLYVSCDAYYCAPTAKQKLPADYAWEKVGTYYGRDVFRADPAEA